MTSTSTAISNPTAATARRRPPATTIGAACLAVLAALVGTYGSVYFTGLEGWTGLAETYVVSYAAISLFGVVAAAALRFGREAARSAGRRGVLAYGVWLLGFSLFKMLRFAESEAAVFGVVGLAVVVLCLTGASRRWAR